MKSEYGKYYILTNEHPYFSVDLQRMIMFPDKLVVKCDSGFGYNNKGHFGILLKLSTTFSDCLTDNEIEFYDEDIIEEYTFNYKPIINFIDFDK